MYSCIQDILFIGNKAKLFQESRPGHVKTPSRYCDMSVLLQIQANDLVFQGGTEKQNEPVVVMKNWIREVL